MLTRLGERFGYRGRWLIITGAAWLLFGFGTLYSPLHPRDWVFHEQLPAWLNALGWVATGAVAIWQGLRGPGRQDYAGHVALYLMPALRIVSYGLSFVVFAATFLLHHLGVSVQVVGFSGGWYSVLVWSLVSFMLAAAADWPNPVPPLPRPPATNAGVDS